METRLRALLEGAAVFLLGTLPAFFLAFNVVFSDVFGLLERAWGVLYVLLGYLVVGAIVGFATRTDLRIQALVLAAPALILLALYSVREAHALPYHLVVLVAAGAGAYVGVLVGRRFRRPHTARAEAQ